MRAERLACAYFHAFPAGHPPSPQPSPGGRGGKHRLLTHALRSPNKMARPLLVVPA